MFLRQRQGKIKVNFPTSGWGNSLQKMAKGNEIRAQSSGLLCKPPANLHSPILTFCVDISPVPQGRENNQQVTYPRFSLRDCGPPTVQNHQLTAAERNLYESLCTDEDIVNIIENETRDQSHSQRWKLERKYRFSASQFYLISRRQHSHDKFAQEIMCPKTFHSRNTGHETKFEPVAIDRYYKFMDSQLKNTSACFKK